MKYILRHLLVCSVRVRARDRARVRTEFPRFFKQFTQDCLAKIGISVRSRARTRTGKKVAHGFIWLFLFPFYLLSFEPEEVSSKPVVGFAVEPFLDPYQKENRDLFIWYPVDAKTIGQKPKNIWDDFQVAYNAPIANANKKPVIVLSPGYALMPDHNSWLIRELVRNGFMVISVQPHDLIDCHANHLLRAQDVKLVLDSFMKSKWAANADLKNIGFVGYSLGGSTGIVVAGGRADEVQYLIPDKKDVSAEDYARAEKTLSLLNKEMLSKNWRENRIKAVFVMAPAWAWLFDKNSLSKINIPVYLIAPANDEIMKTNENAAFFAKYIRNSTYQEIPGKGGHHIFITALNAQEQKELASDERYLLEDDPSVNRKWIQNEVADEAVRFFNTYLK